MVIFCYAGLLRLWIKFRGVTNQVKAIGQYMHFPHVSYVTICYDMLYKVALTFQIMDEILSAVIKMTVEHYLPVVLSTKLYKLD